MDPISQFVIGVGLQLLGSLFAPKPEEPKPPHLDDFEEPTADSSRPIPVISGRKGGGGGGEAKKRVKEDKLKIEEG